jgi:hypothetical protein
MNVRIGTILVAQFLFWEFCFKCLLLCLCSAQLHSWNSVKGNYLPPANPHSHGLDSACAWLTYPWRNNRSLNKSMCPLSIPSHRLSLDTQATKGRHEGLGLPQPLTRRLVPPPFGSGGGAHSQASEGVGESNSDVGTHTVVLYTVYTYTLCFCLYPYFSSASFASQY